jgi:hypothetical protein
MRRACRGLACLSAIAILAAQPSCSDDDGASSTRTSAGVGGGGGDLASSSASASSTTGVSSGAGQGGSDLPGEFTVTGVVTDGEDPLEGAIVMQAGGEPAMVTGPDGAFSIAMTTQIPGKPTVVAAKEGYRTRGVEVLELPDEPITLDLIYAAPPDNESYIFGDPGKGSMESDNSTKYCGHCHTSLTAQFQGSAHAKSAKDPLVQDLYAGVSRAFKDQASCEAVSGLWRPGLVPGTAMDAAPKCYLGGGVLPDLNPGCGAPGSPSCDDPSLPAAQKPSAFGRCADCHAIGIDGKAGGRSLLEATGIAYENGNHCDACHHIRDVDLSKPPGTGGALLLQRPREAQPNKPGQLLQVMFGPYPDVPLVFMGGSYQPKFSTSELCAGCHEQRQEAMLPGAAIDASRWPGGLPTHSTFSEWSAGPFNTKGTPCQFCHMPPDLGLNSGVDMTTEENADMVFGFLRPPERIRAHTFRGPLAGSPRLLDTAVALFVSLTAAGGELTATVMLKNTGCGHALPTGEPMRALLLVLQAEACGSALAPSGGMTLNDAGGAAAEGTIGADASIQSDVLTWPAGAARAKPGDVVRAVRPTGIFDDYDGIGLFSGQALSPAEKGLEIRAPAGRASVLSAAGGAISLSAPLALQPGDRVILGDALPWPPVDGQPSLELAGAPGYTFARVMVDPSGERLVPHYRAVDIASDNRIAPQAEATTSHAFAIPQGCSSASVSAAVLYRPVPTKMAELRGWEAKDFVMATTKETVSLP